jgi:phytoene dehydrogenase-like protein
VFICGLKFVREEESVTTVIVGAGVAGLTCARMLDKAGKPVLVLEASDGVGGRVRSDNIDGYIMERGFQVLFTAYPAAKRQLDYDRLDFRTFEPGAIICKDTKRSILTDPSRDPGSALPAALTLVVSPLDKLKVLQLALELKSKSRGDILTGPDETTESYLRKRGFSSAMINNFFRPFFAGIFLENKLQTSAKNFRFDYKMLSDGQTVVPARGMGQISEQLAEPLKKKGLVRLNTKVAELLQDGERVSGVRLQGGEIIEAERVVISTPAPEAARLTGQPMPQGNTSTINLYWSGDRSFYKGKKILLNANPDPFVNNAVLATNVAPEAAPPGKHLLSATILGVPDLDDETLFKKGMQDLRRMFSGDIEAQHALDTFKPLKVYRIPYAQFAQVPGYHPTLPLNETGRPGLWFAAEFTEASSLNAAMVSGEKAAKAILREG